MLPDDCCCTAFEDGVRGRFFAGPDGVNFDAGPDPDPEVFDSDCTLNREYS